MMQLKRKMMLHGYHYFSKKNPKRDSVESDNVRGLIKYYEETNNPICGIQPLRGIKWVRNIYFLTFLDYAK